MKTLAQRPTGKNLQNLLYTLNFCIAFPLWKSNITHKQTDSQENLGEVGEGRYRHYRETAEEENGSGRASVSHTQVSGSCPTAPSHSQRHTISDSPLLVVTI